MLLETIIGGEKKEKCTQEGKIEGLIRLRKGLRHKEDESKERQSMLGWITRVT